MVYPVTGPIAISQGDGVSYKRVGQRYRQTKPISMPLPFFAQITRKEHDSGNPVYFGSIELDALTPDVVPGSAQHSAAALTKAYEELRGKINDQAQLGAAIAEHGQATKMIYTRGKQILDLIRQIRRGDLVGAAASVKLAAVPKGASVKKSFASNWLEFSFGWRPMVGDINNACSVLENPIKSIRPNGKGYSGPLPWIRTSGSKVNWLVTGYDEDNRVHHVYARTGCEVTITNPNLFLFQSLGLANPMTVAWEVIPFSFVVDWFVSVEQFLSSGTDWLGLGVTNAWHTQYWRSVVYKESRNPFASPQISKRWSTAGNMRRWTGLYSIPIFVRPMRIPGWGRATNAMSLVVQGLSRR
jgi:hypothetical protein